MLPTSPQTDEAADYNDDDGDDDDDDARALPPYNAAHGGRPVIVTVRTPCEFVVKHDALRNPRRRGTSR